MRVAHQQTRGRRMISLTPLIDVVFILLVFFMLASSFLDWRSIELKLPVKANVGATNDVVVVVLIANDGTLKLNGEPIADLHLDTRLAERLSNDVDLPIVIRAAEGVPLQRSIEVLDEVTAAGGRNVSLSRYRRAAP